MLSIPMLDFIISTTKWIKTNIKVDSCKINHCSLFPNVSSSLSLFHTRLFGSCYNATNKMIWPCFFQRRSMTLQFRFLVLLDVTKYSRRVHQSPKSVYHQNIGNNFMLFSYTKQMAEVKQSVSGRQPSKCPSHVIFLAYRTSIRPITTSRTSLLNNFTWEIIKYKVCVHSKMIASYN